jgi:dolichol-phosphate mannosyltransferase
MIPKNDILVAIPTYNERDNVALLYKAIKSLQLPIDFYFIDDNSPDGTGEILDEIAALDSSVHVLHRSGKLGLGTAHIEAFRYARKNNYHFLITMDADFTHDPKYIPQLLAQKDNNDIVIGSRYISGGGMSGWGKLRLPFTYFWRWMIRICLGMPYDCTGAFRLYRVSKLDPAIFEKLDSRGFSFCMESIYFFKKAGLTIDQIPIQAQSRLHGESKLSTNIMTEAAKKFCSLWYDRLFNRTKK